MHEARPTWSSDTSDAEAGTAPHHLIENERVRRRVRDQIEESERRMASAAKRVAATRVRIESALRTAAEAEERMVRSGELEHPPLV
ncbi:hypothetical protein AB0I81_45130 [Nonomuraea sp. NPDC050404]|uniref:hypothetical protein n=1 Tax=Nonomuraea sp. NPDC050404 TaxID=3155783 RepID=UPI00340009AE